MSEVKPCPLCGDETEYWHFLYLCTKRANEIWREDEAKILTDLYKSLDFVQVVRCKDCYYSDEVESGYWCDRFDCGKVHVTPDGFCKWGEKRS